jgi:hypothetical protein
MIHDRCAVRGARRVGRLVPALALLLAACASRAPSTPSSPAANTGPRSVAERLGLPASSKLLILHADDVGLCASVNRAFADALARGVLTSGSVMVPAPAFDAFATWARGRAGLDLGLHTTLTSEWRDVRWGPVLGRDVPSLGDAQGRLYPSSRELIDHASLPELEREVRAQLARARAAGVAITHLDAHMGGLYGSHDGCPSPSRGSGSSRGSPGGTSASICRATRSCSNDPSARTSASRPSAGASSTSTPCGRCRQG